MSGRGPYELTVEDFRCFFEEIHGVEPFSWQVALAERVLTGMGWPEAIDVPTGLGKTAVLDVAIFSLAAQAHLPAAERTAPTRTFMVVDRRVIVDQAHERATKVRDALREASSGVVSSVAAQLRSLSVGLRASVPLEVVRMRGGAKWSAAWLRSPAQPAVVTGTVDQLGSRLLFRGYGVGEYRRPIDAALVGADRLLILDEAHLSYPLVVTAGVISDEETLAIEPVLARRRPRPVLMSATLPTSHIAQGDVLPFAADAETSVAARNRLAVRRLVRLVDLKGQKDSDLAAALAEAAWRQLASQGVSRVLVTVNTVGLARRVFNLLDSGSADGTVSYDRALLVGRCRQVERDHIARQWLLPGGRLSAETMASIDVGAAVNRPVIAVATQTVEVGADLDVDALITECCPLDSLLQRLGRLDRRGRRGTSQAIVLHHASRHGEESAVRSYGPATGRTWDWLVEQAGTPPATPILRLAAAIEKAPTTDLGPSALAARISLAKCSDLVAEPPPAPVALGAQLAAWARTSPAPVPDQEVGPYLHGVDRSGPQVQLCWRALRLPSDLGAGETWQEEVRSVPIGAHELVSVPRGEAIRFLSGHEALGGADLEGEEDESDDPFDEREPVVAWLVDPAGALTKLDDLRSLRPGGTVVVSWDQGGHDQWGWTGRPHDGAVPDVSDLGPVGLRLRLRGEIFASLLPGHQRPVIPSPDDDNADWPGFLAGLQEVAGETDSGLGRALALVLQGLIDAWSVGRVSLVRVGLTDNGRGSGSTRPNSEPSGTPGGGWALLRGPRQAVFAAIGDDDPVDAATSASTSMVDLDRHLRDVEERAQEVAAVLGLPESLRRAVALAGLAHDLGKADGRFQAMLHGGSALRAETTDRLLAKSGMDPTDGQAFRLARRLSGWPSGMRHEAVSAAAVEALAREHAEVLLGVDLDLVRHLVASHHGRSRPLLPPVADSRPALVSVALPGLERPVSVRSDDLVVDWNAPGRFERLGATYGWWGLALLESIVRLADQTVSAEYGLGDEDEQDVPVIKTRELIP